MKRIGTLFLIVTALTSAVLLSPSRNVAADGFCQCETTVRQTTTESAKSAVSCSDAQNKLYNNKLLPQETCAYVCVQGLVTYTVPCYYDATDAHYHVSGYVQYRCTVNGCNPHPLP